MLTLEIEFLTGVCFAALSQNNPTDDPDWPPQPDRVFSALVAAWGTRGELARERAALEWLEQQPPPTIEATGFYKRHVGIVYVPPGDDKGRVEVMPERRRRQARMFPAAIPHRPVVRLQWNAPPEQDALEALQALARDTAYVGHSASVVRCQFVMDALPDLEAPGQSPQRRVYRGRLKELEQSYRRGERPGAGSSVAPAETAILGEAQGVFTEQWIVLEDGGGICPDVRASAAVARRFREALMSRYGAEGLPVPEIVSGHQPDGSPATAPHLAIVPLTDVGSKYSGGRLMGLGLVLPREANQQRIQAERDWLAGLDGEGGSVEAWRTFDRLVGEIDRIELGSLGVWEVKRTLEAGKQALRPERYTRASKRWSSVTPIVLDRFPKGKSEAEREQEINATIASSCANIGLPQPSSIRIYKHAAVKGAISAYPSGKSPSWTRWTLPGFLANRMLTHAVIEFAEPVVGPVLLGAGRYVGLGLCLGEQP